MAITTIIPRARAPGIAILANRPDQRLQLYGADGRTAITGRIARPGVTLGPAPIPRAKPPAEVVDEIIVGSVLIEVRDDGKHALSVRGGLARVALDDDAIDDLAVALDRVFEGRAHKLTKGVGQ